MEYKTKFVTYHQNNSGGYFCQNEDVDMYVIIEGYDLWQIQSKAREIFESYREYCECCGERWDDNCKYEDDMTDEPMIYNKSVYSYTSWFCGNAIIYYLDGTKEVVAIKEV